MKLKNILIGLIAIGVSISLLFYLTNLKTEVTLTTLGRPITLWGHEVDEKALNDPRKIYEKEPTPIQVKEEIYLKIKWGDKEEEVGGRSEFLGWGESGTFPGASPPWRIFFRGDGSILLEDQGGIKLFTREGFKRIISKDYSLVGVDREGNLYLWNGAERRRAKTTLKGEIIFFSDPIEDVLKELQLTKDDVDSYGSLTVIPDGNSYLNIRASKKRSVDGSSPEEPGKTIKMLEILDRFYVTLLFNSKGNLVDRHIGFFKLPYTPAISPDGFIYSLKVTPTEDKVLNQIQRFLLDKFTYRYVDSIVNIAWGGWMKNALGEEVMVGGLNIFGIDEKGRILFDMSSRRGDEKECLYLVFDPTKNLLYSFYLPLGETPYFLGNKIYTTSLERYHYVIKCYTPILP